MILANNDIEEFDLVIEAGKSEKAYWCDLWNFRELLGFLAWKDILVRYKQTVIGILWSVLRPLLTMLVFVLIFNKVAKLPSQGEAPYAIMVFVALLPWQLFANALSESSMSLISNAGMISKIYFPRMIVPLSTIIVGLIDFLLSFIILFVLMAFYRFVPNVKILLLPLFLIMALAFAIGPGLLIAAVSVKYRDFRYIVPFIVQFGLYISPVGFSSSVVPEKWRLLYSLNPMVGVIDGFRWCVLGENVQFYWPGFLLSLAIIVACVVVGIRYFRSTERSFADTI